MPTSDSGDSRRTPMRPPSTEQQELLPCPRCHSSNTKFCYYNNYNFSQPRHFCKSCRRYWTHGGTLRDIPVGGGTRKPAKRSRTCSPLALATPLLFPSSAPPDSDANGGSFTSLFNPTPSLLAFHDDLSFGLGTPLWPFEGLETTTPADYFACPDLSITTPGNSLK